VAFAACRRASLARETGAAGIIPTSSRLIALGGLGVAMSGNDVGERWRYVLRHAMQAETLEGPAKSVGHHAVALDVEFTPGDGLRLEQLALDRQHGDTPRDLALPLAQTISAAKVGRNLV
jgi:hypothetical protein